MNPILLDREVREGFRDLVRGTFGISSPIFRGMIEEFLEREGAFLKGPWITADMPFRSAPEGGEPFPDVPLGFVPHLHQSLAFDRLRGETPKGTLVATGTGSGKTESYLWPILDMCRRRKAEPGIKAILIYPMNALAQDQARRIAKAIHATPSLQGVRAGMYADKEPDSPTDTMGPEEVITRRDAMCHAPPDILLTNYKMLDYLLLRGRDRELWSRNTPETLRFLVVDEIHTFDGAQGADLAMLIRRLKARLETPPEHLACVGSSATLGADEKAATKLCRYAEDVFGEAFSPEAVIREDRLAPHEVFYASPSVLMPPPPAEVRKALDLAVTQDQAGAAETLARVFWEEFDPADPDHLDDLPDDPSDVRWRRALATRLKDADYVRRAFEAVIALGPAAALGEAAERLQSSSKDLKRHLRAPGAAEELLSAIIALAAWARDDDSPRVQAFLGLRVQTWARELVRMVATLPRSEGEGRRETPQLLHSDDIHPALAERSLPVVRCDHCFTAGYLGRLAANAHRLRAEPKQLYDEWFGGSTRLRIIYYDQLLRRTGTQVRAIAQGRIDAETLDFSPAHEVDPARDPIGPQCSAWLYDPTTQQGKIDRDCPHCGAHDALFILGLRSARLGASLAGTLFASRFHEESEAAKPRMLMFSDSVQDAAHRAAVTESRNAKSNQSRALWRAIDQAPGRTMSLHDVAETAPAEMRARFGDKTFVARFIAGDMIWREAYRRLVAEGVMADPILADDVALRLGWEGFSELTWQSRRTNGLVGSRLATIGFAKERLVDAADRFVRHLALQGVKGVVAGPEQALQLLRGVLAELVARGAVDQSYVRLAQIMAEGAGPNWFGARNALDHGASKRQVLPLYFARTARAQGAPRLPTLRSIQQGYDPIGSSSPANWFRIWIEKFSDGTGMLTSADAFRTALEAALECCAAEGLIQEYFPTRPGAPTAWLVKADAVRATTDVAHLCCSACTRKTAAPADAADPGAPCSRPGCAGTMLADTDAAGFDHLRRPLTHGRAHRVVAREHTGLLQADARRALEVGFIKGENAWNPNVISATSTLEMGIDIGDLSSLLLCSVPPRPANFVQRSGRTGRRDGNSLNITTVNGRPHDLQFWEEPRGMLAGAITPPGVHLEAPAVLKRQAVAFTLDRFVAEAIGEVDYGTVKKALSDLEGAGRSSFLKDWLDFVASNGPRLLAGFVEILPETARRNARVMDALEEHLLSDGAPGVRLHVLAAFDEAARDKRRLRALQTEVDNAVKALKRQSPPPDDLDKQQSELKTERAVLTRTIRDTIDNRQTLEFLTDAGLLPNYAFPEVGVKLKSVVAKAGGDRKEGYSPEDLRSFEYVRPPSSALVELAPFQSFYADGRELTIERLDVDSDEVQAWRFCGSCSWSEPDGGAAATSECPRCGDAQWRDVANRSGVVELRSVLVFTNEAKAAIKESDERLNRQYDRAILPRYTPDQVETAWSTDGASPPFGYEFISACEMHDVNFGEKRATPTGKMVSGQELHAYPFRLCGLCGTAQRPPKDEIDPGQHTSRCKARDSAMPRVDWQREIFLMRRWKTEALRIVMPVVGDACNDEIKSFTAAMDLGMRAYFEGAVDHIRSASISETVRGAPMRSLYLYDAVPGGSGYLRQLAEDQSSLRRLFTLAKTALEDCACASNDETEPTSQAADGCHRCVRSWRAHFGPGEPKRSLALNLVSSLLDNWDKLSRAEGSVNGPLVGPFGDSALETRFLEILRDRFAGKDGADPFVRKARSGARDTWQLSVPGEGGETHFWDLETQVQIDGRFPGLPRKRVDFLLTPSASSGELPIVVELDGWEHHAGTISQDLQDRLLMMRSGDVRVWTLCWDDLKPTTGPRRALIPIAPTDTTVQEMTGMLAKLDGRTEAAELSAMFRWLTTDQIPSPSLDALLFVMQHPRSNLAATAGTVAAALYRSGQPARRPATLSTQGTMFLDGKASATGFRSGDLVTMLSPVAAMPAAGVFRPEAMRVLLWADIPEIFDPADAPPLCRQTWQALWTATNLLQGVTLHVDKPGEHGVAPPEDPTFESDRSEDGWSMLEDYDKALEDVVAVLRANGAPAPDTVGLDLMDSLRAVGQAELAWTAHQVALTFEPCAAPGWTLIEIDEDALDAAGVAELAARILSLLIAETAS